MGCFGLRPLRWLSRAGVGPNPAQASFANEVRSTTVTELDLVGSEEVTAKFRGISFEGEKSVDYFNDAGQVSKVLPKSGNMSYPALHLAKKL